MRLFPISVLAALLLPAPTTHAQCPGDLFTAPAPTGLTNTASAFDAKYWTPPGASNPILVLAGPSGWSVPGNTSAKVISVSGGVASNMSQGGLTAIANTNEVLHLLSGDLYCVATFGGSNHRVARWDPTTSTWVQLNGVFNQLPRVLTTYNGQLIALGSYTTISAVSIPGGAARFDGAAWQPMGTGPGGTVSEAAAEFQGRLFVGLSSMAQLKAWDGSAWGAIPVPGTSTVSGSLFDLRVIRGRLYASGALTAVGGVTVDDIASTDGASAWVSPGAWPAAGSGGVYAMVEHGNMLYVCGTSTGAAGSMVARHAFGAGSWTAYSTSVGPNGGPSASALASSGSEMTCGGVFTNVGTPASKGWALFTTGLSPTCTASAPVTTVCDDNQVLLSAAVAAFPAPTAYQWKRNGVDISGANSATLNYNFHTADSAVPFTVTATNGCGTSPVSNAVSLTVTARCNPADLGQQGGTYSACGDHLLDNNDFVVFISLFFTSTPTADLGIQGGTAGNDGFYDNNDFVVFINAFFSPGC